MLGNILIIDKNQEIINSFKEMLGKEGFATMVHNDGFVGIDHLKNKPNLLLIGVNSPNLNGFEICKKIKSNERTEHLAVILFTSDPTESDEVNAFEAGANDFVTIPISAKKLIARIKNTLRNSEKQLANAAKLEVIIKRGPLEINKRKFSVFIDSKEETFPKKEFELLAFLADKPGTVFSREAILKNVWGKGVYVVERTIDVHVRRIRRKLGEHHELIETIKGVGYRFKEIEE